tara:strand:+ start:3473 stop:4207 length:735 start_codon:yes stop_codon:yes gene_type:complete
MKSPSQKIRSINFNIPQGTFSHASNDYIYFDSNGHVYKQTLGQFGEKVWTILSNQNGKIGWYYVDSPYVQSIHKYPSGGINCGTDAFSINNLSYYQGQDGEFILFLHSLKDGFIAFMHPLCPDIQESYGKLVHVDNTRTNQWKTNDPIYPFHSAEDLYHSSVPLNDLPYVNPQSFESITDEEKRLDFNGNYYTQSEFFDYYGGYIEWGFQHPRNVQRRMLLIDTINNQTDEKIVQTLVDKLVSI